MAHWKDNIVLKVVNVITYLFFLSSNLYGTLGAKHSNYGTLHETYFTPEQWVFSVWPLIHLLLLGLVVYQFFADGYHPIIEGVGWRFPVLCILNSIYFAFATSYPHGHKTQHVYAILAWVTVIFITGTVSHIYRSLRVSHKSKNILDTLFIHVPFSLYHGLAVVLLFVSGFAAFGINATEHAPGIFTKIFVVIGLVLLEGLAAGYVFHGEGDVLGAAVISFSLLAIWQHQTVAHSGKIISYSALVFWIISLIAVLRGVVSLFQNRGRIALADEERAPLVG